MDVAIVTANIGRYDEVRTQSPQDIEVDWICFTDSGAPEPWRVEQVEHDDHVHPNLEAKFFKMLPPVEARYVVWIDANHEVTSSSFAREAIQSIHDGLALHRHPRRDCIYDEAEASLGHESQGGRYDDLPIREQVEHYRREGFPERAGLYACGTIAWDRDDPKSSVLGRAWLAECKLWSYQDQLSFPVIARRYGISPGVFPVPQIERYRPVIRNQWLTIHPHR